MVDPAGPVDDPARKNREQAHRLGIPDADDRPRGVTAPLGGQAPEPQVSRRRLRQHLGRPGAEVGLLGGPVAQRPLTGLLGKRGKDAVAIHDPRQGREHCSGGFLVARKASQAGPHGSQDLVGIDRTRAGKEVELRCRPQYVECIASLVASVETKLEAHFSPFAELFRSSTRSVEDSAKRYLRGLYQARRRNMARMAEVVAGSHYQRAQHMLSVSDWDHAGVVRQVAVQAQAHFPKGGRALVIDESGFAKKGECSAGVARQWNGRLGKVDNCQVGVFAALAHDETACLIDAELSLTEGWVADAGRCADAGIPEEARLYRSKAEIALGMIRRARRNGLSFDWVAADGGYGHLPWPLTQLEDEGERFLVEVHCDQRLSPRPGAAGA